jgi:hypothetical protein
MGRKQYLGRPADIQLTSAPGALIAASGAFLVGEGAVSIAYSQDQQTISTIGRVGRIAIGLGLLGWVISQSR